MIKNLLTKRNFWQAHLIEIYTLDGSQFFFTDFENDITYNGTTYQSAKEQNPRSMFEGFTQKIGVETDECKLNLSGYGASAQVSIGAGDTTDISVVAGGAGYVPGGGPSDVFTVLGGNDDATFELHSGDITYPLFNITAADTGTNTFTVAGDQTAYFEDNAAMQVSGSTGNNGTYLILSFSLVSGNTEIVISTTPPGGFLNHIPSATADGQIQPPLGTVSSLNWAFDVSTPGTGYVSGSYPTSISYGTGSGLVVNVTAVGGAIQLFEYIGMGGFDGAQIVIRRLMMPNPNDGSIVRPFVFDTSAGDVVVFAGFVSDITVDRTSCELTLKSRKELLNIPFPYAAYQPSCRWPLYGAGCTLSLGAFQVGGTVAAGTPQALLFQSNLTQTDGYFDEGLITFLSGANVNLSRTVRKYLNAGGAILLFQGLPSPPAPGDTFAIAPGCDKTMQTCQNRFSNLINFGGYPFIPPPEAAV